MKRALAILGGPRQGGNAAVLLAYAAKEAETAGYEVEFIDLYSQNIAYCRGCMACKKTGLRIIEDDLSALREKLLACDLVLLASPTYFANVPAPVKNMFDRLVGAVMDDNISPIPKPKLSPRQKYLLLVTCNTPAPFDRLGGQSSGCLRAMNEFFHTSGMRCMGKIIFPGTRGKTAPPPPVLHQLKTVFH